MRHASLAAITVSVLVPILGAAAQQPPTAQTRPEHLLPAVGLSLTLPEGFATRAAADEFQALSAARNGPEGTARVTLTLAAVPVEADVTLDAFLQAAQPTAEQVLAMQGLRASPPEVVAVAGLPARLVAMQYTFRGRPIVAERVYFVRELPGRAHGLGYAMTLEADPAAQTQLTDVRTALLASLRAIEPQRPVDVPMLLNATPAELPAPLNISIRLPQPWFVRTERGVLQAHATDYLLGGMPYPMLTVTAPAAARTSARACAERSLAATARLWASRAFEVVEQGEATLAGTPAWQAVSRAMLDGRPIVSAQIFALREGRCLTLSLAAVDATPQRVKEILEAIAGSVRFTAPAGE